MMKTLAIIVKMQNTSNLNGQNSLHISDIFNRYNANINGMWNTRKLGGEIQNIWIYTNLKHTCINKYMVDQYLIVKIYTVF